MVNTIEEDDDREERSTLITIISFASLCCCQTFEEEMAHEDFLEWCSTSWTALAQEGGLGFLSPVYVILILVSSFWHQQGWMLGEGDKSVPWHHFILVTCDASSGCKKKDGAERVWRIFTMVASHWRTGERNCVMDIITDVWEGVQDCRRKRQFFWVWWCPWVMFGIWFR